MSNLLLLRRPPYNEVGEYSEKPAEIADIVAGWFSGKDSAKLEVRCD